jgi:hypothetical protein
MNNNIGNHKIKKTRIAKQPSLPLDERINSLTNEQGIHQRLPLVRDKRTRLSGLRLGQLIIICMVIFGSIVYAQPTAVVNYYLSKDSLGREQLVRVSNDNPLPIKITGGEINTGGSTPVDTGSVAYNNYLLEEYLGYKTGYLFKCDTIQKVESNFFTSAERDTTKKMIIDYLSLSTDSTTIGYEIIVKKLTTPTYSKLVFKNERLTGNVTLNFNLVGTPIVLQPGEHLYTRKILTSGEVKSKTWLSVKYRIK